MRSLSERMKTEKKTVLCESCGAAYEASLVRCPYCGTGYAPAEEDEYMGQLEGIRKDLETYKGEGDRRLKRSFGIIVRTVLLIAAVFLLLLFGCIWISGRNERSRAERQKEEFLNRQGITEVQEQQTK